VPGHTEHHGRAVRRRLFPAGDGDGLLAFGPEEFRAAGGNDLGKSFVWRKLNVTKKALLAAVGRIGRTFVFMAAVAAAAASLSSAFAQETKKPESDPKALAIYQDAANFQNNKAFDLAIIEWEKFVKDFPKDPLADKAQEYLGVCQMQQGDFEKAAAAFNALIKNHPKSDLLEEAYHNLGWSYYSQAKAGKAGMQQVAADTFKIVVDTWPKGKKAPEAAFYQGEALYAVGKKDEAVKAYQKLIDGYPESPLRCDGLYALGVTQEELSKYPEAGKVYDLFLKEGDKSPLVTEVRMRKAETVLQAKGFEEAAKTFGEVAAVKDFAAADHALMRQGYCLAQLNKFAEAGDAYAKVSQVNPQSPRLADAAISAGRSYYLANKPDEAFKWLDEVYKKGEANAAEAAHWMCRILLKNKKPAEAVTIATAAVAKAAKDSPYLVNLQFDQADAMFDQGDKKAEALALYAKIATDNPKHELASQALYNAAFAALELKKYDEATKLAAQFIPAYPQDKLLPDVKYVLAECQLQQQKYPEAEATFRDLATNHMQHADIDIWRVRLALTLYLQKKYDQVITNTAALIPHIKAPDSLAEVQFLQGAAQFYSDKFDEAAKSFQASLAANPKWRQADETLLLLSRVERKQDKLAEAKKTVSKIISDFPESTLMDQAYYRLGEYQFAGDEYEPCLASYDVILTKYPSSQFVPYALYGKGWALLKLKKFPEASASFTELLTKHSGHTLESDAHFGRAMSRRQTGEFAGAIEDADAFLKSNPGTDRKAEMLYERGLAEVGMKKFDTAATTFTSLLTDAPKFPGTDKVLYELGWALKSQDKNDEAVTHFAKLSTDFPNSPLAAEALFHVGEGRYEKKEFDAAAKAYAESKAKAGDAELAEKSTYKLGWAYFQLKQFDKSAAEFSEQLSKYAKGGLAADAVFMKAESLFRAEKYKEAWPVFQEAAKAMNQQPTIETLVLLHGGQTASQLKQWPDSIAMLSQIPTKFPQSPLLAETQYELGYAYQNSAKIDEALKNYEAAATTSRDHIGARARFMMGEIQFEKKSFGDAIKEFQRVMYGFGGDMASDTTKDWQAKAGYEAGRCAQVQIMTAPNDQAKKKLIEDAKKFYNFVVEKHAKHELAKQAQKELDSLAKL